MPIQPPTHQASNKNSHNRKILLLQPLPINKISMAELVGNELYFTKDHILWKLPDPFHKTVAQPEPIPTTARPSFLFQTAGTPFAIFKNGSKQLWQKTGGCWQHTCAWNYGDPYIFAETKSGSCLLLSIMPDGSHTLLAMSAGDQIREIPSALLGGEPRNINIIDDVIYIATLKPFQLASCTVDKFADWLGMGRNGNPFDIDPLSLGHCIQNLLPSHRGLVAARSGRTELKTLRGEVLFIDEEKENCGFQVDAAFTIPGDRYHHLLGTKMRDAAHPHAFIYVLDEDFKPVLKKRGDTMPFAAWAGYGKRNRNNHGEQCVFTNTSGWPLLAGAFESADELKDSDNADGLKLEYEGEGLSIFSRDPALSTLKDVSSQTFILNGSTFSKGNISYDANLNGPRGINYPFCHIESIREIAGSLPYPTVHLDYETLLKCNFDSPLPLHYQILWNDVPFDFLILKKSPGKDVVVFGTGNIDKSRDPLPHFKRHSWGTDIAASCIWYQDPSIHLGKGGLCWGYGTNSRWYL